MLTSLLPVAVFAGVVLLGGARSFLPRLRQQGKKSARCTP